jgi:hypothetical protein
VIERLAEEIKRITTLPADQAREAIQKIGLAAP